MLRRLSFASVQDAVAAEETLKADPEVQDVRRWTHNNNITYEDGGLPGVANKVVNELLRAGLLA